MFINIWWRSLVFSFTKQCSEKIMNIIISKKSMPLNTYNLKSWEEFNVLLWIYMQCLNQSISVELFQMIQWFQSNFVYMEMLYGISNMYQMMHSLNVETNKYIGNLISKCILWDFHFNWVCWCLKHSSSFTYFLIPVK